jgi:hypothetical protein
VQTTAEHTAQARRRAAYIVFLKLKARASLARHFSTWRVAAVSMASAAELRATVAATATAAAISAASKQAELVRHQQTIVKAIVTALRQHSADKTLVKRACMTMSLLASCMTAVMKRSCTEVLQEMQLLHRTDTETTNNLQQALTRLSVH